MLLLVAALLGAPRGAIARTAPVELTVGSTRFVLDAPEGMEGYVRSATEVVRADWERVAAACGAPPGETLYVSIEETFGDWFERRGEPSRAPEWASGLAIGEARTILLAPGNPDWQRTLSHEMVHVAIDVASGDGGVPRWVHEGYALLIAEPWDIERATTMIRAGLTGSLYGFDELTHGFPPAASSADLAYAQSFSFVRFLGERHGQDVFIRVFEAMRAGADFDAAWVQVTRESVSHAEEEWSNSVSNRYVWTPALTAGGISWGLVSGLAIVVIRRNRRQRRERLEAMQRSESRLYAADPDDRTFG